MSRWNIAQEHKYAFVSEKKKQLIPGIVLSRKHAITLPIKLGFPRNMLMTLSASALPGN